MTVLGELFEQMRLANIALINLTVWHKPDACDRFQKGAEIT